MTIEEREARLTAYALNDAGMSAADRGDVETLLAGDPAARRAVEETRHLADLLTAGLLAEQSAIQAESVVTIPAMENAMKKNSWAKVAVAAAAVCIAFGGTLLAWKKLTADRANVGMEIAKRSSAPDALPPSEKDTELLDAAEAPYGDVENLKKATGGGASMQLQTDPLDGWKAPPAKSSKGKFGGEGKAPAAQPVGPAADTGPASGFPGGPFMGGGLRGGMPRPGTPPPPGVNAPGVPADGRAPGGVPGGYAPGATVPGPGRPTGPGGPPGNVPGTVPTKPLGSTGEPPAGAQTPDLEDPRAKTDDRHLQLVENGFVKVQGQDALSTFGVDVDTASYAIVRKYLSMSQLPPANAVRLEEMVNYFPYQDKAPDGDNPFAVTVEMADCPWEPAHRLVRLGLKAKPIATDKRPPSNIVFLVDVSGSMDAPNRLPLVKASLKLLVNQLGEKDRVAIVVYAGASGMVLDSTSAVKKETILNALDSLGAGGSTNGAGGIHQAYEVAVANFIKGGTNRVVLCTDGDWNVGTTSTEALVKLIEQKRETGVFLSVFGFGMGNLRDEMMVQLAGKGNGNYGYIDTLREANKALVEQIGGTLVTVAKDVKIQVEFNPAVVKSYRLLGYEKRALAAKDFHDDKKDAGEMGAGHVVTALYELVPTGAPDPVAGKVDGLRYQKDPAPAPALKSEKPDEAFVVKMRHKKPDSDTSTLRELPVKDLTVGYEKASEDFQFAAAVASFAMLLRDSAYKGQSNYGLVLELAEAARKHDPGEYRAEFVELVKKAKALAGK